MRLSNYTDMKDYLTQTKLSTPRGTLKYTYPKSNKNEGAEKGQKLQEISSKLEQTFRKESVLRQHLVRSKRK